MGLIKSFAGAISGTFADQWKDIITSGGFDTHTLVSPGVRKTIDNGRGNDYKGSSGVISNGSKIFVPENTAAFVFSQSGIEEVITEPGGYIYTNGDSSIFNGDGVGGSIFKEIGKRFQYGGITDTQKEVCFVNLREIRDIKFGTRGPQLYHDIFYKCDLEVYAYGSFTIKVTDPTLLVRNFVPAGTTYYSFDDPTVREQLISDFLQSFIVAINSLSSEYRISQIPAQANALSVQISKDSLNAGSWVNRFGFEVVKVSIENIELSDESKALVKQYNENRMNLSAYEDISQKASSIAAQQKIAEGVKDNGFGDIGGMMFATGMVQGLNPQNASQIDQGIKMSFDEQIETLKKLKDLLDAGILTQEEFDAKKKEIMGL